MIVKEREKYTSIMDKDHLGVKMVRKRILYEDLVPLDTRLTRVKSRKLSD